eukprot:GILI01018359.1.p1 GENE.GILI01018359.1~~GILI01018359.1.p1  ORF type:complete len:597 (+),score=18.58 GILI01018359.1:67-1857(+)
MKGSSPSGFSFSFSFSFPPFFLLVAFLLSDLFFQTSTCPNLLFPFFDLFLSCFFALPFSKTQALTPQMSAGKLMEIEIGKLFPSFTAGRVTNQKLDEIHKSLVGSVNVELLLDEAKKLGIADVWTAQLGDVIHPPEGKVWCGRRQDRKKMNPKPSRSEVAGAIRTLAETILTKVKEAGADEKDIALLQDRLYASIFLVAKDDQTARAIGDCKELNEHFDAGPPLQFATVDDLFRIVTFFSGGAAFAIGDFRHWFYQIFLPEDARKYFTVVCPDGNLYEYKVFPMGFAWSPFVAQAISMLMAKVAVVKAGLEVASPLETEDLLPPYWVIKERGAPKTEPIGFILFWYDNLLLVTKKENIRDLILSSLEEITESLGARWKQRDKSLNREGGIAGPGEMFTTSTNKVTYLGIVFTRDPSGSWSWDHVEKNKTKWRDYVNELIFMKTRRRSWRNLAMLLGVLTWHWTVLGVGRETIQDAFLLAATMGRAITSGATWEDPPAEGLVEEADWRRVFNAIKKIISGVSFEHTFTGLRTRILQCRFCASDAMNTGWAGVDLDTNEYDARMASDEDSRNHINWKETMAALCTLEWMLRRSLDHTY